MSSDAAGMVVSLCLPRKVEDSFSFPITLRANSQPSSCIWLPFTSFLTVLWLSLCGVVLPLLLGLANLLICNTYLVLGLEVFRNSKGTLF
jgi:hypothetical protein